MKHKNQALSIEGPHNQLSTHSASFQTQKATGFFVQMPEVPKDTLNVFYKRLSHLKETSGQLGFMISEIYEVLENSPHFRRQA